MRTALVFLFGFFISFGFAQDLKNYEGLESKGAIPKDLVTHSSDKFESSVDTEISKDDKRRVRKNKKDFLLQSSFQLRDFLYSGKIMFNDTLSKYVNAVSDELLKNSPLKDSIRFYIVKSSAVNGFATNDGMIFITLGLLAQVETEAQLAFILGHELSHYRKKHVINSYVEAKRLERSTSYGQRNDFFLKRSKYSRELETEADMEGFKLFASSAYKRKGVERVFDVLKYSYLPFDEVAYDTSRFQDDFYRFPSSYWVDEVNPIATEDDYDEEKSSHPSPDKRKEKIKRAISKYSDKPEGEKYIIKDKEYFKYMRDVARFEISKMLLYEEQYQLAFYHTYLLQKYHKDNEYLDQMMTMSMYYLFRSRLDNSYGLYSHEVETFFDDDGEGESHQVFHFFEQMPNEELGILALKNAVELQGKYESNSTFKKIAFDLMYLLGRDYEISADSFEKEFPDLKPELEEKEEVVNDAEDDEERSKIDKIKNSDDAVLSSNGDVNDYFRYALVNVFKSNLDLEDDFEKAISLAKKSTEEYDSRVSMTSSQKKKKENKGLSLGIEKVVVIDPNYAKFNENKNQSQQFTASEDALISLQGDIKNTASKSGLDIDILDNLSFKKEDTKKFNDLNTLNRWISHSLGFMEKTDTSFFVSIDDNRISEIRKKYNSDHFFWSGFTGIKEKKSNKGYYLCASALYVVTLPFGIYYAVTPEYSTSFYTILLDVKSNQLVWVNFKEVDDKDTKPLIRSILYDTFSQIHKKK